jgi:hypothetical protein
MALIVVIVFIDAKYWHYYGRSTKSERGKQRLWVNPPNSTIPLPMGQIKKEEPLDDIP